MVDDEAVVKAPGALMQTAECVGCHNADFLGLGD
jgi:cytochrome c551/c552